MRRHLWGTLAILGLLAWVNPLLAGESGCQGYGTSVEFYETPSEAAKHAKKEQKLVFVLHVSGNFETSEFT